MGLGIHVAGTIPRSGLLRRQRKPSALYSAIEEALETAIDDPIQKRLTACERSDKELLLRLHPAEEDVHFTVENGRIVASAKTSSAGPGYHAMLVGLLDDLGTRTGIEWAWDEEEADETGFHDHGDFERLRQSMLGWLSAMAGHLLDAESDDMVSIRVCLPIGDAPIEEYFTSAPMGPRSRDWWQAVADGDSAARERAGAEFFAAWSGPDEAHYWANAGRYLMMWDLDWTKPADGEERERYETALGCFARARQMDSSIPVPEEELREAWTLMNGADPNAPPRTKGLGYRRGLMERPLMGSWSASLPGYFRRTAGPGDNASVIYFFGAREVHVTSYTLASSKDGATGESYVKRKASEATLEQVEFTPAHDWVVGYAEVYDTEDGIRTIQAMLGSGLDICLVTILHEDDSAGAAWAKSTLESVYCPRAD